MQDHQSSESRLPTVSWWLAAACAAAMSACGGGTEPTAATDTQGSATAATGPSTSSATFDLAAATPSAAAASSVTDAVVQPLFHLAPVLLDAPGASDAIDNTATARAQPHAQAVPADLANLPTQRLTEAAMTTTRREHAMGLVKVTASESVTPFASSSSVSTYTPAQIRAAYGLPALPAAGLTPSAEQAAQMGAGQTVYIVDAMHDPNAAAELAAFNQKFGLPACTTQAIPATAALPLASASSSDGCSFSVVYSTASGTMAAAAPRYDSGWATEIALDVQWVHATAPLARIVLIEAPSASVDNLTAAVKLANAMGPGIVSMSFGATEGTWTASIDSTFTAAGMTYLAATGDAGAQVSWPAVSPTVLAVGGTRLTYTGTGDRSETGWSSTGGGISQYTATPSYQANNVPGVGTLGHRAVADVSFNADPATGQYVAVMPSGAAAVSWVCAGGTSLSTPQWAGLVAIANAIRARGGKGPLGAPHAVLYGQIGAVPGTYAGAFADITSGSDGSCATCTAKVGYDPLTGLGTPNAATLLSALAGSGQAVAAPVVASAAISGKAGEPLSFKVSVTAANAVTYTLAGAPAGMTVSTAGVVAWAKPVAGKYTVTVTAKDAKTGLSGQGTETINIETPAVAPVVTAAAISGRAGTALAFTVKVTAANTVGFSLSGAPSGMAISSTGAVSWAKPVAGTYPVTVTATDAKTGLSGKGVYTVTIAKAEPPVIKASALTGVAGKPLTGSIGFSDPANSALTVSVTGVPAGMMLSTGSQSLTVNWAKPVAGSYTLTVTAKNAAGASTTVAVPVKIAAK